MVEILPVNARIPVKIGDVTFVCSPMTAPQQAEVLSYVQNQGGEIKADRYKQMRFALKYSLKDIKGVSMGGKPFKLKFDEAGAVSDESLDLISQLGQEKMLQAVVLRWMNVGICDPQYPGVSVELPKGSPKKN